MKKKHYWDNYTLTPRFPKKLLLVMKLTILLTCILAVKVSASVYSQSERINMEIKDKTVRETLKSIEKQSRFRFFYNDDFIDLDKKLSITLEDKSIDDVLAVVFDKSAVTYKVLENNFIVITPVELQQQQKVSGIVTDSNTGDPLIGVTITIEGTKTGAITDANGKFSIDVPITQNTVLDFSYLGYVTQKISYTGQSTIDIKMESDVKKLDEIIVVGYGTQKRVTSTGAVVATKGSELKQSPSTNLTNNLIGRMPGLTAVTRSGEPGNDASTLRVRGSNTLGDNSPLVVIDGVPNRSMERIDPNDIESLTVLKDASAAIYGSQAANGVILITTKRGKLGKPKINLNLSAGYTQPTRIPKMADAAQYATMLNEIEYNKSYSTATGLYSEGRYKKFTADEIQKYSDGSDPWAYPNTDWFKEVFKPWSALNHNNISISGGTENMKYFLSLGQRFNDGFYKNSATNFKQYDFRTNIDSRITKHINVAFDVAGREELKNYPTRSAGSIFRMLQRGKPNMPAFWPDGTPGPDIEYGDNPAVTSTDATGYDKTKTYVIQSNLKTVITIPWVKGLSVEANASFDKTFLFHKKFETPWYLYTWDKNAPNAADHITTKGKRGLEAPQLSEDMADGQNIALNAYATYEKTIAGKHNIKLMVGTERRKGVNDLFNAFRKNYISGAVDQLFAGASDQYMTNSGSATQNAYMSYFGRINYDLSNKYMLEFVWRYDGSYMFPKSKQFGFFPGVSAGWRISEENFWKNKITFFDDFKIRGSWGQTGNDRIAEYQYLTTYGGDINLDGRIDGSDNRTYVFGTTDGKLLVETKIPNPNVTWEVANQANIGFDASFFKNTLSVSADYFNNIRSQILIKRNASVPASAGFNLPPENIGKVQNQGFEGIISYHNQTSKFKYDISVNGSYSKNKVIFWDETPNKPDYQKHTGHPIPRDVNNPDANLYYQAIGIYRDKAQIDASVHLPNAQPGDIIFKDVNNDGVIDGLDRVNDEKTDMPRFIGGVTINLQYLGFDLAVLIQSALGAQQYIRAESGDIGNYYKDFADKRWTPENPNASYPRAYNRDDEYWGSMQNTFWLRSTDYIRLKNIELGYSLPVKALKVLGIENLRVFVNGQNLFTADKAKLIDPETTSAQSYPLQRIVTAGLNLTF
jgi:TonB-linked SusC/RagA family outer membrane protein